MKAKFALATIIVPVAVGGVLALHPGVAIAEPVYARPGFESELQNSGTYTLDPAHTSIGFEVGHYGISKVQGRFNEKSGTLRVDTKNPSRSKIEVNIPVTSIDTGIGARDNHLRTADFFDVQTYPAMTFSSTSIKKKGKAYEVTGNLTLKNVSRQVTIPFRAFGPLSDPKGKVRVGFVSEPFTIKRKNFNVNYDQKLPNGAEAVSNEVTIKISLEATKD